MNAPTPAPLTPQFGTAEYSGTLGSDRCELCGQGIAGSYYRVATRMSCASCAERAKRETPEDTHARFMRALMYGVGAAVLGLILYAAVSIITGFQIGYMSLAVGYLVGKAVMKGSNGVGGRKYQIAAVLLTYAAVSMAAIPIVLHQLSQTGKLGSQSQAQKQATPPTTSSSSEAEPSAETPKETAGAGPEAKPMGFGLAMLTLAAYGLASPFLELADPFHGFIGLIILFVGINFAWKNTASREIEIDGPFNVSPTVPA